MRTFIALAIATLSLSALPLATPVFAATSTDKLCGPDGPESYKRPGGYCEQIGAKSLLGGSGGGCDDYIVVPSDPNISMVIMQKPILVAETCIFIDTPQQQ